MRKVTASIGALFVMAMTFVALALPASAESTYPPDVTVPTTQAASGEASKLAVTGSDSTPLVILAIVAITLGAVLVVAARRRASVRIPKI